MDPELAVRLQDSGVDPGNIEDPGQAWQRLFDTFGERASVIDRYALEAAHRGVSPEALTGEDRLELAMEVMNARYPGLQLLGSGTGQSVAVEDYDERWPETFGRWRERIARVVGSVAARIDHVGSTAVVRLAAKPIVDIQVSVPAVEDEVTYVPGIESLGLPLRSREPGHRYFRPPRGRPRVVHIHVCDAGSEWERIHLLFRDYLRAAPELAAAYGRLKKNLAIFYRDDRLAYTDAKTDFVLGVLRRAESWADETAWVV